MQQFCWLLCCVCFVIRCEMLLSYGHGERVCFCYKVVLIDKSFHLDLIDYFYMLFHVSLDIE